MYSNIVDFWNSLQIDIKTNLRFLPPLDGSVEGTTEKIEESVRNLAIV